MKYLTFTVTQSSFLVATVFLVISLAHADTRVEWFPIYDSKSMGIVKELHTDGQRLYAVTSEGLYVSDDDGRSHTWRLTDSPKQLNTITIDQNYVYAATSSSGMFRSDDRGDTWTPINNGMPLKVLDDGWHQYPTLEQILVTRSGTVIAVARLNGSWISTDRGETWNTVRGDDWFARPPTTWHRVGDEYMARQPDDDEGLPIGNDVERMTEFDGYLWAVLSGGSTICRSPDGGATWRQDAYLWSTFNDWAVLNNRLFIAGVNGLSRWRGAWDMEHLPDGLPEYAPWIKVTASVKVLADHDNILFAGLERYGMYMFNEHTEKSIPVALDEFAITALVSHQSYLYAAVREPEIPTNPPWEEKKEAYRFREPQGIYRGVIIPSVQPHGKNSATWGAVKRK